MQLFNPWTVARELNVQRSPQGATCCLNYVKVSRERWISHAEILFSIKVSWEKLNPWTRISGRSLSSFILNMFVGLSLCTRPHSLGSIEGKKRLIKKFQIFPLGSLTATWNTFQQARVSYHPSVYPSIPAPTLPSIYSPSKYLLRACSEPGSVTGSRSTQLGERQDIC